LSGEREREKKTQTIDNGLQFNHNIFTHNNNNNNKITTTTTTMPDPGALGLANQ